MAIDRITVRGARQHNLKNISVEIPRDRLTVITGLSGSGKSSLAFDTIYAEGQRRYVESLSAYARQFLDQMERPTSTRSTASRPPSPSSRRPSPAARARPSAPSPRSTTTSACSSPRSACRTAHICGAPITRQSVEQIVDSVLELPEGERVMSSRPIVRGRKGEFKKELEKLSKDGFVRARIDGELRLARRGDRARQAAQPHHRGRRRPPAHQARHRRAPRRVRRARP